MALILKTCNTFHPESEAYQLSLLILGPRGTLRNRCKQCSTSKKNLLLCLGCNAVRYCSREHQVKNRQFHKRVCVQIKKTRVKVREEEDILHDTIQDLIEPGNALANVIGSFTGAIPIPNYVRARVDLSCYLWNTHTLDATLEAIDHCKDVLRIGRADTLGVRNKLPYLLLQIGEDQDCYDFVKWWHPVAEERSDRWNDSFPPCLNVHGADVYEDVQIFDRKVPNLDQTIACFVLKMKLLVDVRSRRFGYRVLSIRAFPTEIIEQILSFSTISSISRHALQNLTTSSLCRLETRLAIQCQKLGGYINSANLHFWQEFWISEHDVSNSPSKYRHGSREEALNVKGYCFMSFWQPEGVLELLEIANEYSMEKNLSGLKLDDTEIEAPVVEDPTYKTEKSRKTAGDRLVWLYFDEALKDHDSKFWRKKCKFEKIIS